jgi:hypothetical protein
MAYGLKPEFGFAIGVEAGLGVPWMVEVLIKVGLEELVGEVFDETRVKAAVKTGLWLE